MTGGRIVRGPQLLICCLCEIPMPDERQTHNPDPLGKAGDRCCGDCNATLVIPARLKQIGVPSFPEKIEREGRC